MVRKQEFLELTNRNVFLAPVLVFGIFVIICVWWGITHRCVKSEEYRCSETICTSKDRHNNCEAWRTEDDTCSRCLQWEKR